MNIPINKNASMGAALHMAKGLGAGIVSENGRHCIVTAPPAANTEQDPDRHAAIALARQLLPRYIEQNPKDWRLEATLATAIDFADGLLNATIDPHALQHAKGYALQAAADATDLTSKHIAMTIAQTCSRVVKLERVKQMEGVVG